MKTLRNASNRNSALHGGRSARRGIVILVMLGLLAMFTLVAVTFVVASGQFRRGAKAAARVEQGGDPWETHLHRALMEVVRGSANPQSAIQHQSLLEDMYGNADAVTGCVMIEVDTNGNSQQVLFGSGVGAASNRSMPQKKYQTSAGVGLTPPMEIEIGAMGFGWDREAGVALADDDGNGVVDDITEIGATGSDDAFLGETYAHPATLGLPPAQWATAWSSKQSSLPIIDSVDNYYAGRVITFVNGQCAGQSSHILRSKVIPANPNNPNAGYRTVLFIQPFAGGEQPDRLDRFVINGRPFNGTGLGYNPYQDAALTTPKTNPYMLRVLDMPYMWSGGAYSFDTFASQHPPMALIQNPTDSGLRNYLEGFKAIVDNDEDYDIPDEQNPMLSYTVWVPSTTTFPGRYRTIMPSLHRPDLIKYFMNRYFPPSSPNFARWHNLPPHVRRRLILRPDPSDHYDYTQEPGVVSPLNSDGWTPGEPYQDLNQNGQWDPQAFIGGSYVQEPYSDLNGNKGYDIGDRAYFNSGFDALDGPWDVDNDGDGSNDSIWVDIGLPPITADDGRFVKPLVAVLVRDLDGRINVNAHGNAKQFTTIPSAGGYNPTTKPSPYIAKERNRIGMRDWTVNQIQDSQETVNFQQVDSMANHAAGETEARRDVLTVGDVPFGYNALWAVSYFGDRPAASRLDHPTTGAVRYAPMSFYRGATAPDLNTVIRGFEPAVGQGFSPADVNVAPVLQYSIWGMPTLPSSNTTAASTAAIPHNHYRRLMQGIGNATGNASPTIGKYGEQSLIAATGVPSTAAPGVGGPQAGVTFGSPTAIRPDDNYPPAPFKNNLPSANAAYMRGNESRESFMQAPNAPIVGDYSTPPDLDGDGIVGLDVAGQPLYWRMGTATEPIDDPTELNLVKQGYLPYTYVVNGGVVATTPAGMALRTMIDAPFSPAELERVLRARDSGADALPSRLASAIPSDNNLSDGENVAFTTESWDIPCPHVAPTPELAAAMQALRIPLNNPSFGDLLRARYYLAFGRLPYDTTTAANYARLATIAMRSYRMANFDITNLPASATPNQRAQHPGGATMNAAARKRWHTRLFSPDVAMGLRMDINAPFGNGYDDNGNLIVDEPKEFATGVSPNPANPTSAYTGFTPNSQLYANTGKAMNFDGNRDGNWDQRLDEEARQQFAKELYCLMMLLIDENYVQPLPTSVNSAGSGYGAESAAGFPALKTGLPPLYPGMTDPTGQLKARKWLQARKMAQWAINVVDFRDRDSIMTPFEFDADPFFDNDGDSQSATATLVYYPTGNGTWDVDGYLLPGNLNVNSAVPTPDDTSMPWRGVVWGCEYPDLILTESVAFHDRRTENLMESTTNGLKFSNSTTGVLNTLYSSSSMATNTTDTDADWDSRRIPQGSAFFELYATGNPHNPALPRELYSPVTESTATGNTIRFRLDLGRLAGQWTISSGGSYVQSDGSRFAYNPIADQSGNYYPVWRLAITESHYTPNGTTPVVTPTDMHLSIAQRIQDFPATCSLELSDPGMSLLSQTSFQRVSGTQVPVEKVVVFCNNALVTPASARVGLTSFAPTGTNAIEVHFNRSAPYNSPLLLPGEYSVVGPARQSFASTSTASTALGGPQNITTIGRTQRNMLTATANFTSTLMGVTITGVYTFATNTNYNQPQPIIDMGDVSAGRSFLATSVNGLNEYPMYAGYTPPGNLAISSTNSFIRESVATPQIRRPLTIPCACDFPGSTLLKVGLNISEPLTTGTGYYPIPNDFTTDTWNTALITRDRYSTIWDTPLDLQTTGTSGSRNPNIPVAPVAPVINDPNSRKGGTAATEADRTLLNYKTVFLQRLADPSRPWNQYLNPYLTLDWMPVDLTIFNGEPHFFYTPGGGSATSDVKRLDQVFEPVSQSRTWTTTSPTTFGQTGMMANPAEQNTLIYGPEIRFGSRQRGAPRSPFRGSFSYFDLWSQPNWLDTSPEFDTRPPITGEVRRSKVLVDLVGTGSTVRDYYRVEFVKWQDPLDHTLGYLNLGYHYMRNTVAGSLPTYSRAWLPQLAAANEKPWLRMLPVAEPIRRPFNGQFTTPNYSGWYTQFDIGQENDLYLGAPRRPFNWLTWNNRPFVGGMELMLVPASNAGRLLHEFSMRKTVVPSVSEYTPFANNPNLYRDRYTPYESKRAANHYMPYVGGVGTTNSSPTVNSPGTTPNTAGRLNSGYLIAPPFGHLLNFFESSNATAAGLALPLTDPPGYGVTAPATGLLTGANYFRVFEFVHVPSRFSGTQQMHVHSQFYNNALPAQASSPFTINGIQMGASGAVNPLEHPGWPYTAPFNVISAFREPGKININTIVPLNPRLYCRNPNNSSPPGAMPLMIRNERLHDSGATIWRGVTNEFHPTIRWFAAGSDLGNDIARTTASFETTRKSIRLRRVAASQTVPTSDGLPPVPVQTNVRAADMVAPRDVTLQQYFFNPSEDFAENFYSMFASLFKDDKLSDPRGPDAVYDPPMYHNYLPTNWDDRFAMPFNSIADGSPLGLSRHDGMQPSMFINPFRSYLSDYSTVPGNSFGAPVFTMTKHLSTTGRPLLAIDSTPLRRRDTTWSPYDSTWLPNVSALGVLPAAAALQSYLESPAQVDPRFDPLFALNYPRPFHYTTGFSSYMTGNVSPNKPPYWQYSGYTSPMYEASAASNAGYGGTSAQIPHVRVKDSDYRNTDRNPFFRYQMYTKLSNTVTTRSNVYAIWITVGYFECERVNPTLQYPVQGGQPDFDAKHRYPDGFRLIRELGSDTGETQRHRAFAIFDRTIPVGFLRGENLNVDRAFLIKRIID